jgi:hypothetical protein
MSNAADIAVLRVEAQADASVSYTLKAEGKSDVYPGPSVADLEDLNRQLWGPRADEATSSDLPLTQAATISVPEALERRLRQWALSGADDRTLCISSGQGIPQGLPWEALPEALELGHMSVARFAGSGMHLTPTPKDRCSLLIAGWPRHRGNNLHGILGELTELPARFRSTPLTIQALPAPTAEQLGQESRRPELAILHLAHPGVEGSWDAPVLPIPDEKASLRPLTAEELSDLLPPQGGPSLVVLNAPNSGLGFARTLTERRRVIAVGWLGTVSDAEAADFSLFVYQRLLEGSTVVKAVRAFLRRPSLDTAGRLDSLPMVWLPSAEAASATWLKPPKGFRYVSTEEAMRGGSRADGPTARSLLRVRIDLKLAGAINPALLINGRPPIQRIRVDSSERLEGARLQVACEAGRGTSVYRRTIDLETGVQPLEIEGVQFPILYELLTRQARRRYVNFTVSLEVGGAVLAETTRSVLWMAHNEWMDQRDTWPFIPSFVQPESEGVQRVINEAKKVLTRPGHATASFCGYQFQDPEVVCRQMQAIYMTLRNAPFALDYINPLSSPVYIPGTKGARGQLVRLPAEVITNEQGTCHDLALLFAACAEYVGIRPLVILTKGHTFCGFWKREETHRAYWTDAKRTTLRSSLFGDEWVIRSLDDLRELYQRQDIELLEATAVTKQRAKPYEEACAEGRRKVRDLRPSDFDVAVDIWASRPAIRPI